MDIYIVSDVHGNAEALNDALLKAQIYDNHGEKDPNAYVVQIGDLANCVAKSVEDDITALRFVGNEIDLLLIGNHEVGYFDTQNRFSGFHWNVVIDERLRELNSRGLIQPSFVYGDTLITHAGVSAIRGYSDSAELHHKLMREWKQQHYGHSLFSDVGMARKGTASQGGMLWCDFDREFEPTVFPQVVGHTVGNLRTYGNALCIDTIRNTGLPTVLKLGG